MPNVDQETYKYAFQPPLISFIDISEQALEKLSNSFVKILKFLEKISDLEYYPVITYITTEKNIQKIKILRVIYEEDIESPEQPEILNYFGEINENLAWCLYIFLNIFQDYHDSLELTNFTKKNITLQCKFWIEKLIKLRIILIRRYRELTNENYKFFLSQIFDILKKIFTNEDFSHLECFYNLLSNEYRDIEILNVIREIINDRTFKETPSLDLFLHLMELIDILIMRIKEICRKKAERPRIRPKDIGELITIYEDIKNKYGCYLSPSFWEICERKGIIDLIKDTLGIPKSVKVPNNACVLIYPLLISKNYQHLTDTQRLIFTELVLLHEHSHSLFRHGFSRYKKISPILPGDQKYLDTVRNKLKPINEGLAMFYEYKYIEEFDDSSLRKLFESIIDSYVNKSYNIDDWPYHFMLNIKRYFERKGISEIMTRFLKTWKIEPQRFEKEFPSLPERLKK